MRKRKQRRQKAVLPLKVVLLVDGKTLLGHTLDISASGARIILSEQIAPGASITIEFRHRRISGKAMWCRPRANCKYDHEVGIQLQKAGSSFWGIDLPLHEIDAPEEPAVIPFNDFMDTASKQA